LEELINKKLKYKLKVPKPAEFDNLTVVGNKDDPKAEL
jgi:hypothetical protein